jgi:eukaryotic-like serine/threonine-protein kinase
MIAPASRKIGRFEILQKLGRGGMADVYLANDTAVNQTLALKLIEHAPDIDTNDFIAAERRGAALQARLAEVDEHVVRIFESGDTDGYFYVAMEYIDGQDLAELLRRGSLEPEFAAEVARAVAQTLEHAHTLDVEIDGKVFHGIIHGDIKPKNIRIDSRGEVRVLDFGIAKALSLSRKLTRNEFGSVPYGSPERLEAGEVNVQSDLWSLAVMLYEMVSGRQPFQADTTELLERKIRSRVPPAPPPDSCPEALRRILAKSMAPEPGMRYESAAEFDRDLAAFRAGETVRAVEEDLDQTRRTSRPGADDETRRTGAGADDETQRTAAGVDEETRRTAAEQATSRRAQLHYGQWPPPKPARPWTLRRRIAAGLAVAISLWLAYALIADIVLYKRGQRLARAIDAEQIADTGDIWKQWTALADGNASSVWLTAPRKAVAQKLAAAAGHTIDNYRNGDVVPESAWQNARELLTRSLTLQPDGTARGKLRIAEGHLLRIAAGRDKSAAEYNSAIEKFQEARGLIPNSPDPLLGMARVYVYGLKDIDRAYDDLHQAENLGYVLGKREQAQLADGYRERGEQLFWDTRNIRGMPQEKDQIVRAKADCERALEMYRAIVPWGNASAAAARVENDLNSMNSRLRQIEDDANGPISKLPTSIPDKIKGIVQEIWRLRQLGRKDQESH